MDALKRVSLCDITTFVGALFTEKNEPKLNKYFQDDFLEEENSTSENEDSDSIDKSYKPTLKKYSQDDYLEKENSISEDEDSDSNEKSKRKRYLLDDDPNDEDYDPRREYEPTLRKYSQDDYLEKENSMSEDEDSDSNEKSYTPKRKRYLLDDDPNDEDYDPRRKYETEEKYETQKKETPWKVLKHKNLTEYEMMVQKNREEKTAFLESLKFDELYYTLEGKKITVEDMEIKSKLQIKESLSKAVKNLQAKPKRKSFKTVKRPQPRSPVPQRKSLRLANVDVDLSEEALASRVKSEVIETMQKKLPAVLPFSKALQDDLYDDFAKEFSELDHGNTKPFDDYISHFHDMQLPESQIAKVVYSRITSLAIHPSRENILIAAGSKYGKIGFWNVNSDSNPYVFEPHSEGITHLKFNPELPQLIVSSSYDGTLRCGDLEYNVFNEVYNVSEETSCTHFDFLSPNTFLVAQKSGNVSVIDYRIRIKASGKKHKCHDNPVKTVSVHPLDKSYFISAENKGIIRLWDLRKLQNQPVVEVQHHKRCVQSALFSPLTGKSVLTTSSDDTICLFDSSNLGKSLLFKHSMKHNNQTGRWLTTFRATWLPNTDDAFVVGSMLYPRRIEIYNDKMNNIFNFTHENLNCITSVNVFHPSLPVLAGSNSSGKVYVFSDREV